MLGGSFTSRLNLNLREKHGYTYGARASFDLRRVAGPFVAAAGVRTDVTAAALAETVAEIAGMRVPLGRRRAAKGAPRSCCTPSSKRSATATKPAPTSPTWSPMAWRSTPGPSCRLELAALDVTTVARAAGSLFQPDRLTIVVVGDRKVIEPELRRLPFVKSIELRDAQGRALGR